MLNNLFGDDKMAEWFKALNVHYIYYICMYIHLDSMHLFQAEYKTKHILTTQDGRSYMQKSLRRARNTPSFKQKFSFDIV